ncbi:hypothetical protein ACFLRB_05525 [Acidobacteriota bacterium]
MTSFAAFFMMEWQQFKRKRNIIILLILWVSLLLLVINGIHQHENFTQREQEFVEIEALNMQKFPDYDVYGDEGISVQYCPGPTGIFFVSLGISPDLIGKVDSLVNIGIFDNYKGKSLFRGLFTGIWSFTGILFVFGSLLCLFWASEVLGYKKYLKFLSSLRSRTKAFWGVAFSRMLLLTVIMLLISLSAFILLYIYNVKIPAADFTNLLKYFLSTLLFLYFFFLCGLIIGGIHSRTKSGCFLVISFTWIIFVFVIPGITQKIAENGAFCSMKDYQTEIEKFKIIADFEKRCIEKAGKYNSDNIEQERNFMESYFNEEYPKVQTIEEGLRDEIKENIDRFNTISLLTPSTIYYLNSLEVSTRGYENFKNFYSYLMDLKRNFVRFYIDRYYYNDPMEMVNFIQDDENLYHAKSKLPGNFPIGLLIQLGYIIILFIVSFFIYKKSLFKLGEEDIRHLGDVDLKMDKGNLYVWLTKEDVFGNLLYNLLSGNFDKMKEKGFPGKVVVNGVDIAAEKNRENFIYLCRPELYPGDLKVKHFLNFYARMFKIPLDDIRTILENPKIKPLAKQSFSELSNADRFHVLLAILQTGKKQVYLIDDIVTGLPVNLIVALKEFMDEQARKGSLVIYLTSTTFSGEDAALETSYFHEGVSWEYFCEANKIKMKHESKSKQE